MKQVKAFILTGCPYCKKARLAYNELCENNASYREVPVDWILEDQQPDIADQYDYYYTPTLTSRTSMITTTHRQCMWMNRRFTSHTRDRPTRRSGMRWRRC